MLCWLAHVAHVAQALRDAWMLFEPTKLGEVKDMLRSKGLSEDEIAAKLYFQFDYFRNRIPRRVPPPSVHYWRVRRIYEIFGPLIDSKTKAPLLNDAAWKKANNVLQEILDGNAADAPGYVPYHQRLTTDGQPKVDEDGLALLDCRQASRLNLTRWRGEACVPTSLSRRRKTNI